MGWLIANEGPRSKSKGLQRHRLLYPRFKLRTKPLRARRRKRLVQAHLAQSVVRSAALSREVSLQWEHGTRHAFHSARSSQAQAAQQHSAPKDPRSPFTLHRTAQLSAFALSSGTDHPPPAHHDLPTGYNDAFVRVRVFDVVLHHTTPASAKQVGSLSDEIARNHEATH